MDVEVDASVDGQQEPLSVEISCQEPATGGTKRARSTLYAEQSTLLDTLSRTEALGMSVQGAERSCLETAFGAGKDALICWTPLCVT